MRLIQNERTLQDLELMLGKGTYRIKRINRSALQRDYYVIDAPAVCQDTIAVLVELRPTWADRFYKEDNSGQ